jgi:adenylosuccinate lyase
MNEFSNNIGALSPLDGRYQSITREVAQFFSEKALMNTRVHVELRWLHSLADALGKNLGPIPAKLDLSEDDALAIKEIEKTTRHDVKAVEYFLRSKLPEDCHHLIHFAATSEDINNTSYALMMDGYRTAVLLPQTHSLINKLADMAARYRSVAMLAHTHGQAASPTTLGKEFAVFAHRLHEQKKYLKAHKFTAKMNGATGNYHAHTIAAPTVHWPSICQNFIEKELHLKWNPFTTQIENHDNLCVFLNQVQIFASICIDLSRDIWSYISKGYLKQKAKDGEVGSSTMPHKVNPIDFENAEGNFGLSIALIQHLSSKLPVSRLQRDLSDSTVLRNLGSVFGYFHLAMHNLSLGLEKVEADVERITQDLRPRWELLSEAIQSCMRLEGHADAYEDLKKLSRGKSLDEKKIKAFIEQTPKLSAEQKSRLLQLSPETYIGLASQFVLNLEDN